MTWTMLLLILSGIRDLLLVVGMYGAGIITLITIATLNERYVNGNEEAFR